MRRWTVVVAVIGLLEIAVCTAATAPITQRQPTDIPPQSLESALKSLAQTRNFQVAFASQDVASLRTSGIYGDFTLEEALVRLLKGTGLRYRYLKDGSVIIDPARAEAAGSSSRSPQIERTPLRAAPVANTASTDFPTLLDTSVKADIGAQLQEVLVTADRTESLASKTPSTFTAVTAEQLSAQGITDPIQLSDAVPNLSIDRGNANGLQINIRGVTSTGTAAPSAAFLIDGIYVPDQNAQEVLLYDLDRVEVLRGPQGTLYGRNTAAGVVNLISAAPTSTLSSSVVAGLGNYGATLFTGVLNVPVTDWFKWRLAVNYDARNSEVEQAVYQPYPLPKDLDNRSARLSVLIEPNKALRWQIKFDYNAMRGAGNSFGSDLLISNFYRVPLTVPPPGVRESDPVYLNPTTSQALAKTYADVAPFNVQDDTWGLTSELNWKLSGAWAMTWLAGYREFNRDDHGSIFWGSLGSAAHLVNSVLAAATLVESVSQSQELRLTYQAGKVTAQAGLYYFYDSNWSNLWFGEVAVPTPQAWQRSLGAFGQGTYALTNRWRLIGGLRYSQDDVFSSDATELSTPTGIAVLNANADRGSSSKITWKGETDYDLTDSTLGYLTVATGYKAIGFNPNCDTSHSGCQYRPENLTDYEAGLKTRLLDNSLSLNADYFHYNYRDLQISQVVSQSQQGQATPSSLTTNAAAAAVDGIEIEAAYIPVVHQRLDMWATWLDSRYTSYLIEPSNPDSDSYDGDPLDHSPRWSVAAGYSYTLPLRVGGALSASLRTRYSDGYAILSTSLNSQFWQPPYTKTDAALRYSSPKDTWYVEGYVRNIENTVDVEYINTAPTWPVLNNGTVSTGDPRTFGLRIGAHFQ